MKRRDFLKLGGLAASCVAAQPSTAGEIFSSRRQSRKLFPPDFVWGTATAAYQIEGAAAEDGRGPSVWDTFCKKKGAIENGDSGEVACDHYHRLLKRLGAKNYRFSISWSRVIPEGVGAPNEKGLAFYDRLVDQLLVAGITPACTLFHWDFPEALYQKGGWLNRDVADWFADYTTLIASRFSDRIKFWFTQNEPQCYIGIGHLEGRHAPGLKLKYAEYLQAAHNSMRAHGRAVQALRSVAKHGDTRIGCAMATANAHPATDREEDIQAAREFFFNGANRNVFNASWWLDPILLGHYPDAGLAAFAEDMPKGFADDLPGMKQPLDFMGLNIYASTPYQRGAENKPELVPWPAGYPRTGCDWPVVPQSLYWPPKFIYERYQLPIYITENGLSTRDQVFLDGAVHDPQRIDFTQRYLIELSRAIKAGIPVKGYFHWSLLDNFEWAKGYKERFGLVYVDFPTQQRIPKDSFEWYRRVVKSNGEILNVETKLPVTQVTAGAWPSIGPL